MARLQAKWLFPGQARARCACSFLRFYHEMKMQSNLVQKQDAPNWFSKILFQFLLSQNTKLAKNVFNWQNRALWNVRKAVFVSCHQCKKTHNNARCLFAAVDRLINPLVSVALNFYAKSHARVMQCTSFVSLLWSVLCPLKTNSISVTQFDPTNYETLEEQKLPWYSPCRLLHQISYKPSTLSISHAISHWPRKLRLLRHC